MKSYNETVNNVFRRINEYEKVRKRKRKIISETAAGLFCICMIVIVGIGSHNVITTSSPGNVQVNTVIGNAVSANQSQTDKKIENNRNNPGLSSNLPNNAGSVLPSKQVIRSYPCSGQERYVLPKNGEVLITTPLYNAMMEYGNSVVYEIEVYLLNNAESYLSNEAEWMQEYERISKITKDGQLGLSTYNDGNGQKRYMLLGVVSSDFIENFPVSDRYGYCFQLSGESDCCSYGDDDNTSVFNGVLSYNG